MRATVGRPYRVDELLHASCGCIFISPSSAELRVVSKSRPKKAAGGTASSGPQAELTCASRKRRGDKTSVCSVAMASLSSLPRGAALGRVRVLTSDLLCFLRHWRLARASRAARRRPSVPRMVRARPSGGLPRPRRLFFPGMHPIRRLATDGGQRVCKTLAALVAWSLGCFGDLQAHTWAKFARTLKRRLCRPKDEPWLDWHIRTCRSAREQLAIAWGEHPAPDIAACAVSGISAWISRRDCSIAGRAIRWRSAADRVAMSHLTGGRLGPWSRHRLGRPRQRCEDPPFPVVLVGRWLSGRPRWFRRSSCESGRGDSTDPTAPV